MYRNLAFLVSICFLLVGCQQKYSLSYNPPAGMEYSLQVELNQNSSNMVGEMKNSKNILYKFTVIENNASAIKVTVKYSALDINLDFNNDRHPREHFSSEIKDANKKGSASAILESITEIPLDLTFDKQGKILKADGFEVIEWTTQSKGKEYEVEDIYIQFINNNFNKSNFQEIIQLMSFYPTHKVKLNEEWEYNFTTSLDSSSGVWVPHNCKLKITEVMGNTATINLHGAITVKEIPNSPDDLKINALIDGVYSISMDTGLIIEASVNVSYQVYYTEHIKEVNWENAGYFNISQAWVITNTIPTVTNKY